MSLAPPLNLVGLVAAPHTPFDAGGGLRLDVVARQAQHLNDMGVGAAFIAGSTGEGASLSRAEREALAEEWRQCTAGTDLKLIVHVGHTSVEEARGLAAHAQDLPVDGLASFSPYYFRPDDVESLAAWLAEVAGAAPDVPFYFYDIPALTGVSLPTAKVLLRARELAPSVAGVKFTSPDLAELQRCRAAGNETFEVLFGCDEALMAGWALGTRAAVGSTYNFAAPLYSALLTACEEGRLEEARRLQLRSARLVELLAARGYLGAAKALMTKLGVDVGPPRLPVPALVPGQARALFDALEQEGYFDWELGYSQGAEASQ